MIKLRDALNYSPIELKFGTSGRRGKVLDLTQLEIYVNVRGELEFLKTLGLVDGGIRSGDHVFVGYDLRPSSCFVMPKYDGRGGIVQAVVAAIEDSGLHPTNLGVLPTPALALTGWKNRSASIMVTGSHIPFDWNGYKLNTSTGELLKEHEAPISEHVNRIRSACYESSLNSSIFDDRGMLRSLRQIDSETRGFPNLYRDRFVDAFGGLLLKGTKILFYEHSSAGRDLYPAILEELGAHVLRTGRTEEFLPVDTENLQQEMLSSLQNLADEAAKNGFYADVVVSADGDADRPVLLSCENGRLRFIPGDILGVLAASYLDPDAIAVPISCNDAIDQSSLAGALLPKTKIGSPYVISAIERAKAAGRSRVCGWEPNGGFIVGTEFPLDSGTLAPLPTRDALLPIVATLLLAKRENASVGTLADRLPPRFGCAGLVKEIPRSVGASLLREISMELESKQVGVDECGSLLFVVPDIFESLIGTDLTDGVRLTSGKGEILHLRPSGNADEFRVYAVADTPNRAQEILKIALQGVGIFKRSASAGV